MPLLLLLRLLGSPGPAAAAAALPWLSALPSSPAQDCWCKASALCVQHYTAVNTHTYTEC